MMRRTRNCLIFLSLFLLLFEVKAAADSTATASLTLNWAGASFSGAIAPISTPLQPVSATAQAYGVNQTTGIESGHVVDAKNWNPQMVSQIFDGTNYALTTNDILSASTVFVSSTGNYEITSQDDLYGTIVTTGGSVSITIPYSLSIVTMFSGEGACCYSARDGYAIYLIDESNNRIIDSASENFVENLEPTSEFATSGLISLTDSGLSDGSYEFYVDSFSQVTFVPEPSSLLLLSTGLLAIVSALFRKLHTN